MARSIGLAALSVLELTPPQIVSCAAQAGYDRVGLRLIPATPDEVRHPVVGDTPLARETARRIADTGMRVLDVEIFRLTPAGDVAEFRAALETAAHFGASEALVAGNDPDEARLVERFAEFCELAGGLGIAGNLEPMPWTDVRSFEHARRIVAAAGRSNSGVLIDAIHFDRAESRLEEIGAAPRGLLRYVQLCDAPAERPGDTATLIHQARAARMMPGDGGLDLVGLLTAVPDDVPISLEIPMADLARTVAAPQRAARMLEKTRALLARVDG